MTIDYKKILTDREQRLNLLAFLGFIPDKPMIKLLYRIKMKKSLNLKNPATLDEKLQWKKLYDRQPRYTKMVDKYEVRSIIKERIGEEYLVPLLGVWDRYEDIDFDKLPDTFVLKCNHDSGSVQIVKNKNEINHKEFKKFFGRRLKNNPYSYGREWPYKNVKPRIMAEKYIGSADGKAPVDYKFYCFDGEVDSVMLCIGRETGNPKFYFFDKEWKMCRYNKITIGLPDDFTVPKPEGIDELFEIAADLSRGENFVRVDFYLVDGKPYFGEFTYFPSSGFEPNRLPAANEYLGNKFKLPENWR